MRHYLHILLLVLCGCTHPGLHEPEEVTLHLATGESRTRAKTPDEALITDYNLMIFNSFGELEEKVFVPRRSLGFVNGQVVHSTRLLKDAPYTILVAANLGYEIPCRTLQEALSYRYPLTYPDEFTPGLPMSALLENCVVGKEGSLEIRLERLMARIDLQIDRRALDTQVSFQVVGVKVGGCPRSALLFAESTAETREQVFQEGFSHTGTQVSALNRDLSLGISAPVSLYLLENCQGTLLQHVTTDRGKVFENSLYQDVCSYIELKISYFSPSWNSPAGQYLIYRFYLGEDLNNFDVHRNTRYRILVRPEGDGLQEESWRVSKEGLQEKTGFDLHPAAYNECRSGEDFHLWCEISPPGTSLTIEPLAYDSDPRVAALYRYTVDDDGHGLTIHTSKGGTAVVYFKAGPPVNRDTLAMLVIDP